MLEKAPTFGTAPRPAPRVDGDEGAVSEMTAELAHLDRRDLIDALLEARKALGRRDDRIADEELRNRTVVETAVDAIITIDDRGIIERVNPAGLRLFGYQEEELLGRNVNVLMAAPHRERHDGYLRAYCQTGRARIIGRGREVEGRRRDGTVFPIDLAVAEMHIGGRRMFTGIIHDITERRLAQARAEASLAELQHSHHDLLNVLNLLDVGTIVLQEDGIISFASAGTARLGPGMDGLQGRHWTSALPVSGWAAAELRRMAERPEANRSRFTVRLQAAEHEDRRVEVRVHDDPRDHRRRILFLYDVTRVRALQAALRGQTRGSIAGSSGPMLVLYRQVSQLASTPWPVLVVGEPGVGKAMVAQAIHAASDRREGPVVVMNCAGLDEASQSTLLLGQGSEGGEGRAGMVEEADGGTLVLREVSDLRDELQRALLRLLQEGELVRQGGGRRLAVDVRVVATSHRDLETLAAEGSFRVDLLRRLQAGRIDVPPLRERPEDIPELVAAFVARERLTSGRLVAGLSEGAMRQLQAWDWPGNVRQLQQVIQLAVARSKGERVVSADLPPFVARRATVRATRPAPPTPVAPTWPGQDPASAAEVVTGEEGGEALDEGTRIELALRQARGNRRLAAQMLGISRSTFYRRLHELGIDRKSAR